MSLFLSFTWQPIFDEEIPNWNRICSPSGAVTRSYSQWKILELQTIKKMEAGLVHFFKFFSVHLPVLYWVFLEFINLHWKCYHVNTHRFQLWDKAWIYKSSIYKQSKMKTGLEHFFKFFSVRLPVVYRVFSEFLNLHWKCCHVNTHKLSVMRQSLKLWPRWLLQQWIWIARPDINSENLSS